MHMRHRDDDWDGRLSRTLALLKEALPESCLRFSHCLREGR
jgi:hypothetical protein